MPNHAKFITGRCQQLLFSPKGDIEGVLVGDKGGVVQVTMEPGTGAIFARAVAPGSRVCVLADPDDSPKTREGLHPVYQFRSFADAAGKAIDPPDDDAHRSTIKGVVAALHFARHGQPNGVVLETGEFVHLRPDAMARSGLGVGSRVTAIGDARLTVLGNCLLEARKVNGVECS